jgi:tRNA (guanine37-N1)-methyltransferase
MRFDIFTLFPAMFESPFAESIIRRAIDAGLVDIHTHNIRDYATDKHKITDDYSFGGGGGMVLKPEPIFRAVEDVLQWSAGFSEAGEQKTEDRGQSTDDASALSPVTRPQFPEKPCPIILMSAGGRRFTHAVARELAQYPRIALICGHYEGVDERVREQLCTDEISIGDFVLTGGELPAMVIIDAVSRLIPGTLPPGVPDAESHAMGQLEYPHYTRPADFRGWKVPDVLLSGNHALIAKWRSAQSAMRTRARNDASSC